MKRTTACIARPLGAALLIGAAVPACAPAYAQSETPAASDDPASSGEIIVTARKRSERLQDVPAAISALGAQQLDQYAINDVADAAKLVPQLIVGRSTSGTGATIFLRGIGTSSLSAGYEQSVGINIDNVQISRGNAISMGYLDMAQFEVLKGPQALYFGKNSPGGVISISSKDPSIDPEFSTTAGYEFAARQFFGEAIASGPVADGVMLRAALRYSDEDGFFRNTAEPFQHPNGLAFPGAVDKRYPGNREFSGRLTALIEPADRFTIRAKLFYGNLDGQPAARDNLYCRGTFATPVFGLTNTGDDCKLNRNLTAGAAPVAFTTGNATASKDGRPLYQMETWLLSADVNYDAEDFSLNSITAYYDTFSKNYVSFWAGAIFGSDNQDYRSFSQELRLATKFEFPLNIVVGGLYQDSRLGFIQSANIAPHGAGPTGRYDSYERNATQTSRTWSLFGEAIWDITDNLQLDGGLRATWEEKDFVFTTSYVHPALAAALPLNHPLIGTFKDDNVSPQVTLSYKPSSRAMVYAAYRTGFKSGGFNASLSQNFATTIADARFDSEKARSFEVGAKLTLDDGLYFNASLYDTRVRNLQVLAFNAQTISFLAQNAGRLNSRGAEAEIVYDGRSGGEGLQLRAAAAYNHAEYADYVGPCFAGQTIVQGCDLNPGANGAFRSQDFSGRTPPRAPRWTASAGVNYDWTVADWRIGLGSDLQYVSKMQTHDSLSPFGVQRAYALLNAIIGFENEASGWKFDLIGKNLTNRYISFLSTDVTFSGSGTGTANGIAADLQGSPQVGRTVAVRVTKTF